MAIRTEARTLDISKAPGRLGLVEPVILRKGESGLTDIEAHIISNGVLCDLSDYDVSFFALNAVGGVVRGNTTATDAAKGIVTYTVDGKLTVEDGAIHRAYFEISQGGDNVTTADIPIVVLDNTDVAGFMAGLLFTLEITSTPENGEYYDIGEAVTYTLTIVNHGKRALDGFSLSANYGTLESQSVDGLAVGDSVTVNGTFTPGEELAGQFVTITVTGSNELVDKEASSEQLRIGYKPSMKVEVKVKNKGTGIDGAFTTGDTVELEISVINDGNVEIDDIEVETDLGEIQE